MSMSRSEKRIIELLRGVGRMRATVGHGIAQWGKQVDDDLLVMAEELEALRGDLPQEPEDDTDGRPDKAAPRST